MMKVAMLLINVVYSDGSKSQQLGAVKADWDRLAILLANIDNSSIRAQFSTSGDDFLFVLPRQAGTTIERIEVAQIIPIS